MGNTVHIHVSAYMYVRTPVDVQISILIFAG